MPVPVNNKPKGATGVKKKNLSTKASNGVKKELASAGAKATTISSQAGKKSTRKMSIKSEPRSTTETSNAKNIRPTSGEAANKLKTQSFNKNQAVKHKQKAPLQQRKVHPEVKKLVNMLKASIKDEINESLSRLTNIKAEKRDSFDVLNNIKQEISVETEGSTSFESWESEYDSEDSSDDEFSETGSCTDSECSCCTDTDDSASTDNTSSCSDDDNDDDDEQDDENNTSSGDDDDDFTDEYTLYDSEERCICGKCTPSPSAKTNAISEDVVHKPKHDLKSSFMQKADQIEQERIKKAAKTFPKQVKKAKKIVPKKVKGAVKPKAAQTKKKCAVTTKTGISKKKVASTKTGGPAKKNTATTKAGPSNINTATTKAGPSKKNIANNKAGTAKKNAAPPKIVSQTKKTASGSAAVKKPTPLTEITNVNTTRSFGSSATAAHPNQRVIIKKPFHAAIPTTSNFAASKPPTKSSTSSVCCTWGSVFSAASCSRPRPTNSQRELEEARIKVVPPAPKGCRSIGVGCHLPDANSTFKNHRSERLWRF